MFQPPELDRFTDYQPFLSNCDGIMQIEECNICGRPAQYRFESKEGAYCAGCKDEVQAEYQIEDEEVWQIERNRF